MEPEHFQTAPRSVTVAALQFSCDWNVASNLAKGEAAVRAAQRVLGIDAEPPRHIGDDEENVAEFVRELRRRRVHSDLSLQLADLFLELVEDRPLVSPIKADARRSFLKL